jgi:hypothetical protein
MSLENNKKQPINKDLDITDPKKGLMNCFSGFFKDLFKSENKIGELNGKWAFMLKVVLMLLFVSIPTFFAWGTWVTTSIFEQNTAIQRLQDKTTQLPPEDWRRRIEMVEIQTITTSDYTRNIDKQNSENHAKILILLENIKTKVEMMTSK